MRLPRACLWASSRWSTAAWLLHMAQPWVHTQVRQLPLFVPKLHVVEPPCITCPCAELCRASPSTRLCAATGTPFSVAAGRLSFTDGFSGPAVSIDTACHSAMVAARQAAVHMHQCGGEALSA